MYRGNLLPAPDASAPEWINPIGGMGDMLMVAGVLKQVHELDPSRRFRLVRRSSYRAMLQGHPAIREIGFPPKGAAIVGTDYWRYELNPGDHRPYQVLARLFGLPTPAREILFFPGRTEIDPILLKSIPWGDRVAVIATASDSPRKRISAAHWRRVVQGLREDGFLVLQTGKPEDTYIEGSFSLLGLTDPGTFIGLVRRAEIVITPDTFAMHAAYLTGTPAVVLWGPTDPAVYGYPGHVHLRDISRCDRADRCFSAETPDTYLTPCPLGDDYCMQRISPESIREAALRFFRNPER